jgi:hypothetical protein
MNIMKHIKPRKKIMIIAIFLILLLFLGVGVFTYRLFIREPYLFVKSYRKNPEMSLFTSTSGNYTILYPSVLTPYDWQNGAGGDYDIVTLMGNEFEYNRIIIYKRNLVIDKEALFDWGKEKIKNLDEVNEISLIDNFNGYYHGYLREYTIKSNRFYDKRDDHCYNWFVAFKDNGYNFSFCVDVKYWDISKDVFVEMINSIKFHQ